ncbi:2-hydroxyacyl-CoA dehydratase family protein, partial [bacterium]|nr:2-hydroxyacyl-CoA dehydratase family protein [bacterium]
MEIPSRATVMLQARKDGYKIAAILPFHYPRALLRAYGLHPMEVWGPSHIDHLDGIQHFPEYTCKIVQNATQFLINLPKSTIDCILIPHTCDSLQGMASVMKDFIKPDVPVLTIYHPRGRRESDLFFIEEELKQLAKKLEPITGKSPTNKELSDAIQLEDEATALLAEISLHRKDYNVSDREFYTVLRSREYLSTEEFIEIAQKLPKGTPDLIGPGLMISGIVPEPPELFDHINAFGAHIVT